VANRIYIAIGLLAILFLGAAFVVPWLIDWNSYKPRMEQMTAEALGIEVAIEGDMAFTLLPQPRMRIEGVRLGPATNPLAEAEFVEANFSLMDFLRDRFMVTQLRLVRPRINLTIDETGHLETPVTLAETANASNVSIQQARFEDAVLTVSDMRSGESRAVTGFSGDMRMTGVRGPFVLQGGGEFEGAGYTARLGTSELNAAGQMQLSAFVRPVDGRYSVTLEGLLSTGANPNFEGQGIYRQAAAATCCRSSRPAASSAHFNVAPTFQWEQRGHDDGGSFDYDTYAFVVGSAVLVAGVTGSMAENWHTQNRAFRQQSLALAEIDELKDRFLAITSHEIRGPLTAIIAGIDTVWRRGHRLTDEQRERLLEMVSRQSHHVARLVDDLLTTSQLQAGKLTLQLDWAELAPAFESALEAASAKRRSHQLEVDIEPLQARLDSARVEQIVRNLVENAYKYTPDRTRVRVAGRSGPEGVVIEVADDGEGIPEDKREYLFQAFTRIEATTAGKDGVGLGLYVVSQLVAAMDGHIDMTSSSSGTTFVVHLPCALRPADERQVEVARDPAQAHA
jgi:signal transduction histidine kinase